MYIRVHKQLKFYDESGFRCNRFTDLRDRALLYGFTDFVPVCQQEETSSTQALANRRMRLANQQKHLRCLRI